MSAARADLWPAHLRWPTKAKAKAKKENENERKNILAARPAGRLAFIEPPTAPRAALPERPEMNGLVIGVFAEKFACCFCCRRSFSFCFCSAARRRRRCRGSQQLATSPLTFMAAHQSNDKICCRSSILLVWPSGRRLIGAPVRAKFPLPSPSALHWLALRCAAIHASRIDSEFFCEPEAPRPPAVGRGPNNVSAAGSDRFAFSLGCARRLEEKKRKEAAT